MSRHETSGVRESERVEAGPPVRAETHRRSNPLDLGERESPIREFEPDIEP